MGREVFSRGYRPRLVRRQPFQTDGTRLFLVLEVIEPDRIVAAAQQKYPGRLGSRLVARAHPCVDQRVLTILAAVVPIVLVALLQVDVQVEPDPIRARNSKFIVSRFPCPNRTLPSDGKLFRLYAFDGGCSAEIKIYPRIHPSFL